MQTRGGQTMACCHV